MSKSRKSKQTKMSKNIDLIIPTDIPILLFEMPKLSINDKFLVPELPKIQENHIEERVNKPFDYSTIEKYFAEQKQNKSFMDGPRSIEEHDFTSFILQNQQKFDSDKTSSMKLLDETFKKIPAEIDGIYTTLTEFQRTSVAAMLDIEEKRCVEIVQNPGPNGVVDINAAVFSDPVGSGKTLVILTLIRIKPSPVHSQAFDFRPIIVDDMTKYNHVNRKNDDTGFRGFIKRKYKKIIPCTIIFAGVSVAKQWSAEIETFTNFKYFEVVDVRGLDQLMNIIENGDINKYDVIIVKNGTVTRNVALPGNLIKEDKNLISTPYIYNIIGNLRNISWARCIIDDFDNIQLPPNASIINACFTWYISSTTKIMPVANLHNNQFTKTDQILMYDNVSCGSILRNQFLFTMFNVRNDSKFVENNNGLTNPLFYLGVYHNSNDGFTKLIDSFSNEETNAIVEMINSGAINTAAEKAGVASKSAADIFQTILGKNYELYKRAVNVIKFIEKYETEEEREQRMPASEIPADPNDPEHTYTKTKCLSMQVPLYKYPNLGQIFKEVKEEQQNIYTATDISLKRVKENIKSGNCPICSESINEIDGNIMICKKCNVTGCEDCITLACSFYPVNNIIKGKCPMCRMDVLITDMIHVSKDIELLDVVNDNFKEIKNSSSDELIEGIDIHDTDDPKKRTKISALIDIIKGKLPVEFKEVKISLNQLQTGKNEIIESINPFRKILIFTSYEESIDIITTALNLRNIAFWRLSGTASNINAISRKFNSHQGDAVLIINSSKHCAGLNLQSADWLIYFHKVKDLNIETQIAGRGQRIGRKSTLKIGYLLFNNEVNHLSYA